MMIKSILLQRSFWVILIFIFNLSILTLSAEDSVVHYPPPSRPLVVNGPNVKKVYIDPLYSIESLELGVRTRLLYFLRPLINQVLKDLLFDMRRTDSKPKDLNYYDGGIDLNFLEWVTQSKKLNSKDLQAKKWKRIEDFIQKECNGDFAVDSCGKLIDSTVNWFNSNSLHR